MQTPRNHEMDDEPKIAFRTSSSSAFDPDGDALADAADFTNRPATDRLNRRIGGAQHKDALQPDAFQLLTKNARLKSSDVSGYVRQLRHSLSGCSERASQRNRFLSPASLQDRVVNQPRRTNIGSHGKQRPGNSSFDRLERCPVDQRDIVDPHFGLGS